MDCLNAPEKEVLENVMKKVKREMLVPKGL